jgi:hypothetical protein
MSTIDQAIKSSYDVNRVNTQNWNYDITAIRQLNNLRRRTLAIIDFFNQLVLIPASLFISDGSGNITLFEPATEQNQFVIADDGEITGLDWQQPDHESNITNVGVYTHDDIDTFIELSRERGALVIGDASGNPSRLELGDEGKILVADSGQPQGVNWIDAPQSPFTAKGDLLSHDGSNDLILPIGVDGTVLTANPATTTGLEWASIPPDAWDEPTSVGGLAFFDGLGGDNLGTFPVGADGEVLQMDSTNGVYGWSWVVGPNGTPPVNIDKKGSLLTYFSGSEQELLVGNDDDVLRINNTTGRIEWRSPPNFGTSTPLVSRFILAGDQDIRAVPNLIGIGTTGVFYDRISKQPWTLDVGLSEIPIGPVFLVNMLSGAFLPFGISGYLTGTWVIETTIKWSASDVSFIKTQSTLTATNMRAQWSAESMQETYIIEGDPFSNPRYRTNNDQTLSERTSWSPRSISGTSSTATFTHVVRVDENGIVEHGVSEGNVDPSVIYLRASGTISTGVYIPDILPVITIESGSSVVFYYYAS